MVRVSRSLLFAVAAGLLVLVRCKTARAEDPLASRAATENLASDPEDNPDYRAPKGSLPKDGVTIENPPATVRRTTQIAARPIDWNKKTVIVSTGVAGFAAGYGYALYRAQKPPYTGGQYNNLLRVPFAGPALFGSRFIPAVLQTHPVHDDFNTSPGWVGVSAVLDSLVLVADTALQIGGAIAVVYGATAPIRKTAQSGTNDVRVAPVVGFKSFGFAGAF